MTKQELINQILAIDEKVYNRFRIVVWNVTSNSKSITDISEFDYDYYPWKIAKGKKLSKYVLNTIDNYFEKYADGETVYELMTVEKVERGVV